MGYQDFLGGGTGSQTSAKTEGKSGGSMEGTDWVQYAIMAAGMAASALGNYLAGGGGNVAFSGGVAENFMKFLGPKLMAGLPENAISKMFTPVELNWAAMPNRKSVPLVMGYSGGAIAGGGGLVAGTEAGGGSAGGPPGGGTIGGGTAGGGLEGGTGGYVAGGGGAAGGNQTELQRVTSVIDSVNKHGYLPTGRNTGRQMV